MISSPTRNLAQLFKVTLQRLAGLGKSFMIKIINTRFWKVSFKQLRERVRLFTFLSYITVFLANALSTKHFQLKTDKIFQTNIITQLKKLFTELYKNEMIRKTNRLLWIFICLFIVFHHSL